MRADPIVLDQKYFKRKQWEAEVRFHAGLYGSRSKRSEPSEPKSRREIREDDARKAYLNGKITAEQFEARLDFIYVV